MFTTKKTIVRTSTGKFDSSKFSKTFDDLMNRGSDFLEAGMEMLDSGMKAMDEAFADAENSEETVETVSTTYRIRLTPQHISDLNSKKSLTFKADGVTFILEGEQS